MYFFTFAELLNKQLREYWCLLSSTNKPRKSVRINLFYQI